MVVKELKDLLKDLPDDMQVTLMYNGNIFEMNNKKYKCLIYCKSKEKEMVLVGCE
jgi:hypothetical protein